MGYIGAMTPAEPPQPATLGGLDILEVIVFSLLLVLVGMLLVRCYFVQSNAARGHVRPQSAAAGGWLEQRQWHRLPELQLVMLALPLHLLWEIAQFPLYTVWHEGDWTYILYGLVHCTLGDMMILLSVFWLLALLNRSRYWVYASPVAVNAMLFTVLGVGYTIYSEIVNTRIKGTWGYTELMPIIPVFEVGGMPFLQWLLISPVLLWLMRLTRRYTSIQPGS